MSKRRKRRTPDDPQPPPHLSDGDAAALVELQRNLWPALMSHGVGPLAGMVTADGRPAAAVVISTRLSPTDVLDVTPRIVDGLRQTADLMEARVSAPDGVPEAWTADDAGT